MTVKELIKLLSQVKNQDAEIQCFNIQRGLINIKSITESEKENKVLIVEDFERRI